MKSGVEVVTIDLTKDNDVNVANERNNNETKDSCDCCSTVIGRMKTMRVSMRKRIKRLENRIDTLSKLVNCSIAHFD